MTEKKQIILKLIIGLLSIIFMSLCFWLPWAIIDKKYKEEHAYGKYPFLDAKALKQMDFPLFGIIMVYRQMEIESII